MNDLVCLSVSFQHVSIGHLEDFIWPKNQVEDHLRRISHFFSECVYLATCNRVEVYGICRTPLLTSFPKAVWPWLSDAIVGDVRVLKGEAAAKHLFLVASSVESMNVGEPQILGQVKRSYEQAVRLGLMGGVLDRLFQKSFHAAKDVRTKTALAQNATSFLSLVSRLIPCDPNILVIGAGEMIASLAAHIEKTKPQRICFLNRSFERAQELAKRWNGQAESLDSLFHLKGPWDVILTCTGSEKIILDSANIGSLLVSDRETLLLDLSVPKNCSADLLFHPGVRLVGMEQLQGLAEENRGKRKTEIFQAEQLISYHLDQFIQWYERREKNRHRYAQ